MLIVDVEIMLTAQIMNDACLVTPSNKKHSRVRVCIDVWNGTQPCNKQTALFTFTVDRDDKHQPVSMVTDVICL